MKSEEPPTLCPEPKGNQVEGPQAANGPRGEFFTPLS
jgi:hypothetical protein